MQRRIAFVLGKKPRPGTIIAEVLDLLAGEHPESRSGAVPRPEPLAGQHPEARTGAAAPHQEIACTVLLPHEEPVREEHLADADLVVHRGLSGAGMELLGALEGGSASLCNPWAGMQHLHDRAALHRALGEADVPSPRGGVRRAWGEVLAEERRRRVVVKAVTGPGRGRGVLPSPLPDEAPMDGPYLVEELIEHDGTDHKLYVAGERVFGLLKPSPLVQGHTTEGTPFEVPPEMAELAHRTLGHLDLHLAGVDVVLGPDGPVVVDVNAFPGYRGVDGAAAAVSDHLLSHLG